MNDVVTIPVTSPHMIAEIEGPIGRVTFDKPERLNAVSLDTWEAMPEILQRSESGPLVRVIVLKGIGKEAFVSGVDISEFETARSADESNAYQDRRSELAHKAFAECCKPTIASIRGFCVGGGMAAAIGRDIRNATRVSKFGVSASRFGLGFGAPGWPPRAHQARRAGGRRPLRTWLHRAGDYVAPIGPAACVMAGNDREAQGLARRGGLFDRRGQEVERDEMFCPNAAVAFSADVARPQWPLIRRIRVSSAIGTVSGNALGGSAADAVQN